MLQVVVIGQVVTIPERNPSPHSASSSLFSVVAEGRLALLHSLEDKLVFSVETDRMIHAMWYIIKVCELTMSTPEC